MNASLILTALFNGAWQGAVLCGLALLAFRLFRRLNATTMFTVWSVLLAIAVLLPFANYAFATKPVTVTVAAAPAQRHIVQTTASIATRTPVQTIVHDTPRLTVSDAIAAIFRYAPGILALLVLVALMRLALLARDVVRMLVSRSRVRPIAAPVALPGDISRPFTFAASSDFTSPCVLGFTPALIVLPEDLLARGEELASVVLHEREHVRRFDDVQNVVQRFIGAVAFFCPGVRIALRELALYREQICDDAAVNATGDRVSYAMTLTDLAQWAQGRGAPVPSLIFKRKHLMHRLEVLLDSAVSHSLNMNRRFAVTAAFALVLAAIVVLRFQVPVVAFAAAAASVPAHHAVPHAAVPAHHAVVHAALPPPPRSVAHVSLPAPHAVPHVTVPHVPVTHVRLPHPHPLPHPAIVAVASTSIEPPVQADVVGVQTPDDVLDALNDAGLRNLSVDELIAIRDHGVNARMIRAAHAYFGRISAEDLTYLADRGVGPHYLQTLSASGITGIDPHSAVELMDHGVSASLIGAAYSYFGHPSAPDLINLADHGVSARFIEALRENGLTGIGPSDAVELMNHGVNPAMIHTAFTYFRPRPSVSDLIDLTNHGVDCAYIQKVLRFNPRASVSDVIRLRDSGF